MRNVSCGTVLLLGSGALKIGQAGEFDYSGSQALKALREDGIRSVLINPNIATIQTSEGMADAVYFLPVTPEFVTRVIEKERPDGILLAFGGQTALNCGVALEKAGVFGKYGVRVLGTSVKTIEDTEDRELFCRRLAEIGAKTARSRACADTGSAVAAAAEIGYPVMLRAAYALGGSGSGLCAGEEALRKRCERVFSQGRSADGSPAPQVLIEEWLGGWKEIEYEVVRDGSDNCITVCNMENFDPLGIHTGESIVVAPSQTLTDSEHHKLRRISIDVIRHLGVVGECNVQYALDPASGDYRVIEVNARLSRSSALASKATGYPLAFVAAKLALGYDLTEIGNSVTGVTKACFEPALDYVVVKVPRWDLGKFKNVDLRLGSEMKSVGEVMSIARSFEEALQKALRMRSAINAPGLSAEDEHCGEGRHNLRASLLHPTDRRVFIIYRALSLGWSIDRIHSLTRIDKWFLAKIRNVWECERELQEQHTPGGGSLPPGLKAPAALFGTPPSAGEYPPRNAPPAPSEARAASVAAGALLDSSLLSRAKRLGFSDARIGQLTGRAEAEIRALREQYRIRPAVKQIDTLAAEYPAKTNYLYMTYSGEGDDVAPSGRGVVVLGSGAYRIGSSVEFDWCCVNAVQALREAGRYAIMVNCNPETVSTDYDVCDRLYFEELSFERVIDIYERERPEGMILSMGGQTPNNLATRLYDAGVLIYGTSSASIDMAEDRNKFSALLDRLGIEQPAWRELREADSAREFARAAGYPVLIRPSYVLSGAAMNVAWDEESLERCLKAAAEVSAEHPVVISKFIENAKEVEIDAVAGRGEILYSATTEHVENAGVHSGDATVVLPAQRLYIETIRETRRISREIARALDITGPFNIQFLAQDNRVRVIECNLRASRSFPFCSKVTRVNMVKLAVRAMLGLHNLPPDTGGAAALPSALDLPWVGVKAAQFSFGRLHGADPVSGVEMASTGEVGCVGESFEDAFLKALLSVGYRAPEKKVLLSTGPIADKLSFLDSARKLAAMGCPLAASHGTAKFLRAHGVPVEDLYWPLEKREPNIATLIKERAFDLCINIPKDNRAAELRNDYLIRRLAADFDIPLITNIKIARAFIDALAARRQRGLEIKSWQEYNLESGSR